MRCGESSPTPLMVGSEHVSRCGAGTGPGMEAQLRHVNKRACLRRAVPKPGSTACLASVTCTELKPGSTRSCAAASQGTNFFNLPRDLTQTFTLLSSSVQVRRLSSLVALTRMHLKPIQTVIRRSSLTTPPGLCPPTTHSMAFSSPSPCPLFSKHLHASCRSSLTCPRLCALTRARVSAFHISFVVFS